MPIYKLSEAILILFAYNFCLGILSSMMVISPSTKPEGIQYYPGMHGLSVKNLMKMISLNLRKLMTTQSMMTDYFMKDLTVHSRHIWTIVVLLILHQFNMKCSSRPILMKEDSEE